MIFALIMILSSNIQRQTIQWDEATNIGIGKYIFSFGESGAWEVIRPLFLSVLLGLIWLINLNVFIFGKILLSILSIGSIILIYLLAKNTFDKKTGYLAVILLSLTPIFIYYSNILTSNIPSVFIGLLAMYYLYEKKYELSGLLVGIAFLTRFTSGILLVAGIGAIFIAAYYSKKIKTGIKKICKFLLGFLISVLPYLILNGILYTKNQGSILKAIIWPFVWASQTVTEGTPWLFPDNKLFYILGLGIEIPASIFIIFGIAYFFKYKKYKSEIATFMLLSGLLLLIYYSTIDHNLIRFILDFSIFLIPIIAYGILETYSLIKSKLGKCAFSILVVIIIMFSLIVSSFSYDVINPGSYKRNSEVFKQVPYVEGTMLTSDPLAVIYSDSRMINAYTIDRFIYYLYQQTYDNIIYIPEGLVCQDVVYSPKDKTDEELRSECKSKKIQTLKKLKNEYQIVYEANNEYSFIKK